jgi:hypothetical protein
MLGMSLVRLPFREGTAILLESSRKFLELQKEGPQEITCDNKILLYERLRTPLEACLQWMLLRNESKGTILPHTRFAFGQGIPANYNSKIR